MRYLAYLLTFRSAPGRHSSAISSPRSPDLEGLPNVHRGRGAALTTVSIRLHGPPQRLPRLSPEERFACRAQAGAPRRVEQPTPDRPPGFRLHVRYVAPAHCLPHLCRPTRERELRAIERCAEAWSRSHSWTDLARQLRAVQRLENRLSSVSSFIDSRRRDLRDLFRGSEWLDHKGDRLQAAERLLARPDFALRMNGSVSSYLMACRRSENVARRQQRPRLGRLRLAVYSILFLGCLGLLVS
jgi:hypothetical protein